MLAEAINESHRKITLSVESPVQLLLIKPAGYVDARNIAWFHPTLIDRVMTFKLFVRNSKFIDKHGGLYVFTLEDQYGTNLSLLVNSDLELCQKLHESLEDGTSVLINARLELWNDTPTLKNARWVPEDWLGGIYPIYGSIRGKIGGQDIQDEVLKLARQAISSSTAHEELVDDLRNLLSLDTESLNSLLSSYEFVSLSDFVSGLYCFTDGSKYRRALRCAALLNCIDYIASESSVNDATLQARIQIAKPTLTQVNEDFIRAGYTLTGDQQLAIQTLAESFTTNTKSVLLSGDVGTGKALVIAGAALATSRSDGITAIMLPNEGLALQIRNLLKLIDPSADCDLVTSNQKPDVHATPSIMIGTSALVNYATANQIVFDLLVVDEEQKFGQAIKDALVKDCTVFTSSTATCIPRTMQLTTLRNTKVAKLNQRHVKRQVSTRLLEQSQSAVATSAIRSAIESKQKVLIVLPVSKGNSNQYLNALSVEENLKRWDAFIPGRVTAYHGAQTPEERQMSLDGIAEDKFDIIIATSAAETGLNIANLTYCLVLEPKRFGLTQLHQIRGRLGRQGEASQFHMLPITNHSEERLETLRILESVDDGFEIAEHDLELRGFGGLGGKSRSQSGHVKHIITNYKITPGILMKAVTHFDTLVGNVK